MIEAFWSRMQVELLDRKRWNTRLELADAIFEWLAHVGRVRMQPHHHSGMRIQGISTPRKPGTDHGVRTLRPVSPVLPLAGQPS